MRCTNFLIISFFVFFQQLALAEENPNCQFDTALELCISEKKESGFIAAQAALETYKNDPFAVLLLKEAMCYCVVPEDLNHSLFRICGDVIRDSKDSLSISVAWYQKSRISYHKSDYKNALIYSEIALKTLERVKLIECENGNIPYKTFFEYLCHSIRKKSYEKIEDRDKSETENEILKTYDFSK